MPDKPYDDIPGTFVFDAERSRQGYHLNMFCMSLSEAANRKAFLADEASYLDRYPVSTEQRDAVGRRDWLRLLELGGNVYYLAKIAGTDGHTYQYMAGEMTGMSEDDFRAMMVAGGRPIEGNRSTSDPDRRET